MAGDLRAPGPGGRGGRCRVGQDHADGRARRAPGAHRAGASRRGAGPDVHHQGRQRAALAHPRRAASCRRARRGAAPAGGGGARRRPRAHGADLPRLRRQPAQRARPAHRPRARHPRHHRRRPLPARSPRGRQLDRRRALAVGPPAHGHPEPPGPRQRDERAPRLPGRRRAGRRRGGRVVPPGAGRGGGRQEPQDLARADREGAARDRPPPGAARPGRRLPAAQGRPRADGLLRPDRARRPARLRAVVGGGGRAREVQGRAPRRVPGHLGRAGRDARPPLLRPDARDRARARRHRGR